MVVSLDGITLFLEQDEPIDKVKMKRNKIAGSARTNNINLGVANAVWKLNGYVKTEAAYKALQVLMGQSGLTFVDKFSDSFTVSPINITPVRKPHDFMPYTMTLEEDT